MNRTLIVLGAVCCVLSGAVLLLALAYSGQPSDGEVLLGSLLGPFGIIAAGLLLAAGLTMIGVGSGRWQRPRPVPDRKH